MFQSTNKISSLKTYKPTKNLEPPHHNHPHVSNPLVVSVHSYGKSQWPSDRCPPRAPGPHRTLTQWQLRDRPGPERPMRAHPGSRDGFGNAPVGNAYYISIYLYNMYTAWNTGWIFWDSNGMHLGTLEIPVLSLGIIMGILPPTGAGFRDHPREIACNRHWIAFLAFLIKSQLRVPSGNLT